MERPGALRDRRQAAHRVAKVDDVGLTFIAGGRPEEIRIEPDPERLNARGVPLGGLIDAVRQADRSFPPACPPGWTGDGRDRRPYAADAGRHRAAHRPVGQRVAGLCARRRQRRPGAARGPGAGLALRPRSQGWTDTPAVSLAIAKRKGANAVVVASAILKRVDGLKGRCFRPACRSRSPATTAKRPTTRPTNFCSTSAWRPSRSWP